MTDQTPRIHPEALRDEILGSSFRFTSPFGERLMVYADYTASGRNVRFIERYLMEIEESYANTHTEDDVTGRDTTDMFHRAESIIKEAVNGNEDTCLIETGSGTTGAIKRLQEILGVYIPPATRDRLRLDERSDQLARTRPVVFIGPFEHHSNELPWRESLAEVVSIGLDGDGGIDLAELERRLNEEAFADRLKIGSFSACSNVTGMRTPVYEIARILHRHDALACFDFAASAPYVELDMNRDAECYFDALFFSPHKFLGGPGASGILLFNRKIYRHDLAPTFAGGGTVDYAGPASQDYVADIEAREKPGTPATLQLMRASLAIELVQAVGVDIIEERERRFTQTAMARFAGQEGFEPLGNPDPERRIGIVSFNIRHGERYLHPKLVTRLLNDLFGIQSRAGCSCAGPYGHYLLAIDAETSDRYRAQIDSGCQGIKPGWVRVGFHYSMDDLDVDYICRAIIFLSEQGHLFLPLYSFSLSSGAWSHIDEAASEFPRFGLAEALREHAPDRPPLHDLERQAAFKRYLAEADDLAAKLRTEQPAAYTKLPEPVEALSFFNVVHYA